MIENSLLFQYSSMTDKHCFYQMTSLPTSISSVQTSDSERLHDKVMSDFCYNEIIRKHVFVHAGLFFYAFCSWGEINA